MQDANGLKEFFGDATVKDKVTELWAKVFDASNKVLHQNKVYGFGGIEIAPSPNIHDMMVTLLVLGAVIDVLYAKLDLEYEQERQLLNAKAQITTMERVASALKARNRQDYDAAVAALDKQAVL